MANSNHYLSTEQTARHLGVSKSWIEKLRVSGFGPPYFKIGARRVIYRLEDLDTWIEAHRAHSTSEASKLHGAFENEKVT